MNEEQKLQLVAEAIDNAAASAKAYLRGEVRRASNLEALKQAYADASNEEWEMIRLLDVDLDEVRKLRGGRQASQRANLDLRLRRPQRLGRNVPP